MVSGIFADLILMIVLSYGYVYLEGLSSLGNPEHILFLFLGLIFVGGLIGLVSSFQSVRKYLYTSVDDLY
ncbi:MAG: ABC transporter permease, partial [Cytophagales bacterium]|nr:ABC transporter permease [Cytophagales bacterium]